MAKIKNIIPVTNFEKVRDRIGEIIVEELTEQLYMGVTGIDPEFKVFVERFVPFDITELPAISVSFANGDYSNYDSKSTDGNYTFNVDVYTASDTEGDVPGDQLATFKLERLIGILRGILKSSHYLTLGFDRPSISNTKISNIQIADPKNYKDAGSVMHGRIVFHVRVTEDVELSTTFASNGFFTSWVLFGTNKGYQYFRY